MTVRMVVSCEGTTTDRPTVALETCRGGFPTRESSLPGARHAARLAGWTMYHGRDLCPACTAARRAGR